jgi:uncharacterized protein YybS (DUF2232 family)
MMRSWFGCQHVPFALGQIVFLSILFCMPMLSPPVFGWIHGVLAVPVFCLFAVNGENTGKKQIVISLFFAGLGALLLQEVENFLFLLPMILMGYVLFKSAWARDSATKSGGKAFAVLGFGWLLFWGGSGKIAGINPYSYLVHGIDIGLQQAVEFYSAKGADLSPEMAQNLIQMLGAMREIIPRMLPALLLSIVLITVWNNLLLINSLARRLTGVAPWGPYATWKLPDQLVWLPVVAIASVLFMQNTLLDVGSWMLLLAGTLYSFQGLAVSIALFKHWRVPLFFRIILCFLCIMQSYGLLILALLGLSDVWFDLRKKLKDQ